MVPTLAAPVIQTGRRFYFLKAKPRSAANRARHRAEEREVGGVDTSSSAAAFGGEPHSEARRSLNGAPFAATVNEKNMARIKDAQLDAAAARAWMARWQEVGRTTLAEAQALTAQEKLDHLESLMLSADLFDWPEAMELEDERVRALWMHLHTLNDVEP